MCPFPADPTTESPSSPEEQSAHKHPVRGGSGFKKRKHSVLIVAVVALVVGTLALVSIKARKGQSSGSSPQSTNALADASRPLRLRGTTEAVQTRAILAPLLAGQQVGTLSITKLALAGGRVKRGDLLVEFDRQAQVRDFMDKQAEHIAE